MVSRLEDFTSSGGSVLLLGGNSIYWKICFDRENRTIECRKDHQNQTYDGTNGGRWDRVNNIRVITDLMGIFYRSGGYTTYAPYKVLMPEHWVFENTGLEYGDLFGLKAIDGKMASGFETDKKGSDWPEDMEHLAQGLNPIVPSRGPYYYGKDSLDKDSVQIDWNGEAGAVMCIRDFDSGGILFNVGSLGFYYSLWADSTIQQIVHNVARRCMTGRRSETSIGFSPISEVDSYSISIYPNPIHDKAFIKVTDGYKLGIFDIKGNKVFESSENSITWVPDHSLPNGIYIAIASNGIEKTAKKIQYMKN